MSATNTSFNIDSVHGTPFRLPLPIGTSSVPVTANTPLHLSKNESHSIIPKKLKNDTASICATTLQNQILLGFHPSQSSARNAFASRSSHAPQALGSVGTRPVQYPTEQTTNFPSVLTHPIWIPPQEGLDLTKKSSGSRIARHRQKTAPNEKSSCPRTRPTPAEVFTDSRTVRNSQIWNPFQISQNSGSSANFLNAGTAQHQIWNPFQFYQHLAPVWKFNGSNTVPADQLRNLSQKYQELAGTKNFSKSNQDSARTFSVQRLLGISTESDTSTTQLIHQDPSSLQTCLKSTPAEGSFRTNQECPPAQKCNEPATTEVSSDSDISETDREFSTTQTCYEPTSTEVSSDSGTFSTNQDLSTPQACHDLTPTEVSSDSGTSSKNQILSTSQTCYEPTITEISFNSGISPDNQDLSTPQTGHDLTPTEASSDSGISTTNQDYPPTQECDELTTTEVFSDSDLSPPFQDLDFPDAFPLENPIDNFRVSSPVQTPQALELVEFLPTEDSAAEADFFDSLERTVDTTLTFSAVQYESLDMTSENIMTPVVENAREQNASRNLELSAHRCPTFELNDDEIEDNVVFDTRNSHQSCGTKSCNKKFESMKLVIEKLQEEDRDKDTKFRYMNNLLAELNEKIATLEQQTSANAKAISRNAEIEAVKMQQIRNQQSQMKAKAESQKRKRQAPPKPPVRSSTAGRPSAKRSRRK